MNLLFFTLNDATFFTLNNRVYWTEKKRLYNCCKTSWLVYTFNFQRNWRQEGDRLMATQITVLLDPKLFTDWYFVIYVSEICHGSISMFLIYSKYWCVS